MAVVVRGGRVRVPVVRDLRGRDCVVLVSDMGRLTSPCVLSDYSADAFVRRLITAYGIVYAESEYVESNNTWFYTVYGYRNPSNVPGIALSAERAFQECGLYESFIEFDTLDGKLLAVVSNGTLYPFITEFIEGLGDNGTADYVYLQENIPAVKLSDIPSIASRDLCWFGGPEPWSPWENRLNNSLNMPVVPLILPESGETIVSGDELTLVRLELDAIPNVR